MCVVFVCCLFSVVMCLFVCAPSVLDVCWLLCYDVVVALLISW